MNSNTATTEKNPIPRSRRALLRGLVGLGAAAPLAANAKSSRKRKHRPPKTKDCPGTPDPNRRRLQSYWIRRGAAYQNFRVNPARPDCNGDEKDLDGFIGNFSKTLPHNSLGEVDPAAYKKLVKAFETENPADFEAIPLGGSAQLANPQAAIAYSLTGGDSHVFPFPAAPKFSSAQAASEMGEVYLHALLRDVPFDSYGTDPAAAEAVDRLNEFSDFRGPKVAGQVTTGTLFRGETSGDLIGNYISQFLLLPYVSLNLVKDQLYKVSIPGDDHMLTDADWLNIQNGGAPTTSNTFDPTPRYLTTSRDLGDYVHFDFSYQAYLNAALVLFSLGAPAHPNNPYNAYTKQGGFITFGGAEILTRIADVALNGLKAAWYNKWRVNRRLRPEVMAGRIHYHVNGPPTYPLHPDILSSDVLNAIATNFGGDLFLPMGYPEGSPTHPAYPAGHAVIAGACVTTLKAFFDENWIIPVPQEVNPTSNGTALQPYTGPSLTVGNELNKLANNIAIGRDLAGVHYRTDGTEGLLLGEKVAVRILKDHKKTYNEDFSDYSFTGFAGNTITI